LLKKFAERLRVALIAGSLGQGGAEKQLVYLAKSLLNKGIDVRIFCLTRQEYYETALNSLGITPVWVGRYSNPLFRLAHLATVLQGFHPHIIQSTHSFANLYAALAARLFNSISFGSFRNDVFSALESHGHWGRSLLQLPHAILVNSITGQHNAISTGVNPKKIHLLPNVIDLVEFDRPSQKDDSILLSSNHVIMITTARMIKEKRLERFLSSLALARRAIPELQGVIIGDGPERHSLEKVAGQFGLLPDGVLFLGQRVDVPSLLRQASLFVFTSDSEGLPNAILEAMAARLPVITTPAGDAPHVVQGALCGYVVPFDDIDEIARQVVGLARSPELRKEFGSAGRRCIEQRYSYESLATNILGIYHIVAEHLDNHRLRQVLDYQNALP
jgi:glycosyltransferase involved in cell wall biosynthesis